MLDLLSTQLLEMHVQELQHADAAERLSRETAVAAPKGLASRMAAVRERLALLSRRPSVLAGKSPSLTTAAGQLTGAAAETSK